MNKWRHPEIQDLDNMAFVLIRQHFYDLLHELHMAENHKIVHPERDYNVYWDNLCELVEGLPESIDMAVHRVLVDSHSSASKVN